MSVKPIGRIGFQLDNWPLKEKKSESTEGLKFDINYHHQSNIKGMRNRNFSVKQAEISVINNGSINVRAHIT
jgi:hypothetical protein